MISIITSSNNELLFNNFQNNIHDTIGIELYEIIKIENNGEMSLCKAYNEGIKSAKHPILVFAHIDIIFHVKNWGNLLIETFKNDTKIGMLGIAGSTYKSYIYSGWSLNNSKTIFKNTINKINDEYIHVTTKGEKTTIVKSKNIEDIKLQYDKRPTTEKGYVEVLLLDGMFLATKVDVINQYPFDEIIFNGFHGYDIDICFEISRNYNIVVTYDILIEHLSMGNFDCNWINYTKKFHSKWRNNLPRSLGNLDKDELIVLETKALRTIFPILNKNKIEIFNVLIQSFELKFINILGLKNWILFQFEIFFSIINFIFRKIIK